MKIVFGYMVDGLEIGGNIGKYREMGGDVGKCREMGEMGGNVGRWVEI
ncbi:MAG: hypothetical protein J5I98_07420 [Phaeodactylibacter sp.]|nr:hypothetical protein [Phaeodactylibacter sp.]